MYHLTLNSPLFCVPLASLVGYDTALESENELETAHGESAAVGDTAVSSLFPAHFFSLPFCFCRDDVGVPEHAIV